MAVYWRSISFSLFSKLRSIRKSFLDVNISSSFYDKDQFISFEERAHLSASNLYGPSKVFPRSRWPDRIELWSDHLRAQAHTCSRCARITWSGKGFVRIFVWIMVWNLPDQRPLWSGAVWSEVTLVWDALIRGSFKRTLVWSEADSSAHWSGQRPSRAKFFFKIFLVFLLSFVVSD